MKRSQNSGAVAAVAPTRAAAAAGVPYLKRHLGGAVTAYSLPGYLAAARAPGRVVVCPAGSALAKEIDFLRAAYERILWPPPDEIVLAAIEGLLGSLSPSAAGSRRRRPRAPEPGAALLLEGIVTPRRARAALASDARLWIVEHAGSVRIGRPLMEKLRSLGVRWSALDPVIVVGVLASPRLAAARSRWMNLLPAGTPLWIRGARPRRRAAAR